MVKLVIEANANAITHADAELPVDMASR